MAAFYLERGRMLERGEGGFTCATGIDRANIQINI